ncbi:MAG: hypothetical protein ACO1NU_13320 [Arcticibacter sp.]
MKKVAGSSLKILGQRRPLCLNALLTIALAMCLWYYDPFHKTVEPVDNLIGRDYSFALNYLGSEPNDCSSFKTTDVLNEFQAGVLSVKVKPIDSRISQCTWNFRRHKVTIWTARTAKLPNEIIDAVRYKNNVQF